MAILLTRQDDSPLTGSPLSVSGATNATPIVLTTPTHGYATGDFVQVAGVGGNTAANGNWTITVLSPTTFSLNGSAGNGAYTSGGTATRVAGFTIERGVASAKLSLKAKNTGAFAVAGAQMVLYVERAPGSGAFVTSGHPAVDERMGRFEVTGQDSTATPGQQIVLGQVQAMGHLASALLPTILPGDWILLDVWLEQGTSSASGGALNVTFEIAGDQKAVAIARGIAEFAHGILTGVDQPESYLLSGRGTTATGTPDDQVHVAAGSWLLNGDEYVDASVRDVVLNQDDVASEALTSGQSYIAAITEDASSSPTVTKGLRATTPARPTPPAGQIILAWVTVHYQAGGISVIAPADIDADLTYGRLLVTAPATGLSVTVHAGRAIGEGFMQIHALKEDVVLTASATNRIWLDVDGSVFRTLSDTPPSPGAHWLANAVTSGTAVTSLVDKRTYITPTGVTLAAHATTHSTVGADFVSPASIGAAATSHTHAESEVTNLVTDLAAKMSKIYQHVEEFVGDGASQPSVAAPIAAGTVPAVYLNGQRRLAAEWSRTGQAFTLTPVAATGETTTIDYWSSSP